MAKKVSKKASKAPRPLTAAQIGRALERFSAPAGTDRYDAGKLLIATAEQTPGVLYPHFDRIAAFLSAENKIMRWNAQRILAALAGVDGERKIDGLLETYFGFITGTNMISAANSIGACGRIGQARPDLLGRIVPAILRVEGAVYETAECRNVAIGHALDAFKALWGAVGEDAAVRGFVERQTRNTRATAARRAKELLGV